MNKIIRLFCISTVCLFLPYGTMRSNAQTFLTNGLLTYYPFNGSAVDATGNGHDGAVMGATLTTNRFGQPQCAYAFDGTRSVIVVTNSNNLQPMGDFSVSVWAQIPVIPNNAFLVLMAKHDDRANDSGWIIDTAPLQFPFLFEAAPLFNGNCPQVSIPTNAWFQATFTYQISSQICNFYINGILADSRVQNYNTNSDPNPFTIGANTASFTTSGYDDYFQGQLDDIRIYNRALSGNEVEQLYAIELDEPTIGLIKSVKPSFSNLSLSTNYQLQVSSDLINWTNQGSVFMATNSNMVYPQYFDVNNWNSLFFRLQVSP
jgi:hypothetical protein